MRATSRRNGASRPAISIVGAGPAGLACAIVLARAGRKVVVREQHEDVGRRFHGDFQGLENWSSEEDAVQELKRQGIDASFDHHAVSNGVAFDAWGAKYQIGHRDILYYLVRRGSDDGTLDRGLLRQARDLGVDLRFGDRVKAVDGPAILAGGPRMADAIAEGYVFDTDMSDGNWICFDSKLAPLGYAYLLVHGGRGTVASCMFADFKRHAEYVARTVAAFEARAGLTMRNARRFGGYASFRLPRVAVQGDHLVVGEQAGFQDALAGFGMRYAMRSGILAARSILEDVDYVALWKRDLLPLLQTAVANRFLFNVVGDLGWRWMLAHRLRGPHTRWALNHLYRASSWTRLAFPVARWRYRAQLRDGSCDHQNCSCVWCRCGTEEGAGSSLVVESRRLVGI